MQIFFWQIRSLQSSSKADKDITTFIILQA